MAISRSMKTILADLADQRRSGVSAPRVGSFDYRRPQSTTNRLASRANKPQAPRIPEMSTGLRDPRQERGGGRGGMLGRALRSAMEARRQAGPGFRQRGVHRDKQFQPHVSGQPRAGSFGFASRRGAQPGFRDDQRVARADNARRIGGRMGPYGGRRMLR